MTKIEENRFIECIFYLYFSQIPLETKKTKEFWLMISNICTLNKISNNLIVTSLRLLMENINTPTDVEIVYLCNKGGLSVRDINNISNIYWQRQKEYYEEFKLNKIPNIMPRVRDVLAQQAMRKFIRAIYKLTGIFNIIDYKIIDKAL